MADSGGNFTSGAFCTVKNFQVEFDIQIEYYVLQGLYLTVTLNF